MPPISVLKEFAKGFLWKREIFDREKRLPPA
jgi:hypothetical protein